MIIEIKNGNFLSFISLIIKNTINWNDGPKTGLINGVIYPVFNTPRSYFLDIFIFRMPIYFSLLIISTYCFLFTKNFRIKNQTRNFTQKF